ncbi:EpsG family protein [Vibrio splendidus]|uniref:EpsG family protein n=1 Tax=Vibrio splendidus TaxID=29497 RepID=UPI003D767341
MVALAYAVIPFSPYISYLIFILATLFSNRNKFIAIVPGLILTFVLTSISRDLFTTYQDDFETYYLNFISNDFIYSFYYFGSEISLPILNLIIKNIFGDLSPHSLLFVYVFIQYTTLIWALYNLYDKINFDWNAKRNEFGIYMFLFLAFVPFFAFTIYIRQGFAISFFILALSFYSYKSRFVFLIISFLFHHSLLIFYFFFKLFERYSRKRYFFIISYIVLFFFLPMLITIVKSDFYNLDKIRAWLILDVDFSVFTFLMNYKYLVVSILFLVLSKNNYLAKLLFLIISFCFVVDYFIPYISVRFMLPIILLAGFLFYISFYRISNVNIRTLIFALFFVLASLRFYTPIYSGKGDYSDIFKAYELSSTSPFYYVDKIISSNNERHRDY